MKPDREPCLSDGRNTNARGEPPAAPDSLSLSLWLQLMKSSKAVEAAVSARFRAEFDQSLARFDVLSQLYRMDGRRGTVGQIAGQVMASGGNITALIHRMVEDGLVVRSTSPVDRRSSEVTMSPAGLALFLRMADAHRTWVQEALEPMPEREKKLLVDLLRQLRQIVDDRNQAGGNRIAGE